MKQVIATEIEDNDIANMVISNVEFETGEFDSMNVTVDMIEQVTDNVDNFFGMALNAIMNGDADTPGKKAVNVEQSNLETFSRGKQRVAR